MSTAEEWRPVPGFPGYEVSTHGRVVSHRRGTPRVLKSRVSKKGYHKAALSRALNDVTDTTVHRLMMLAFVGPCPEGMEVRHLDGNPANNALSNLAYGTHTENMADTWEHGTHSSLRPHCRLNHLLMGENVIQDDFGRTWCRKCAELRAAWEERRAAP